MLVGRVFVSGGILEEGWIIEGTGQGLCFSSGFLEKGWAVESAKRGARFLLSLYKNRDCFLFISSFLAGKEAKEAGGTYEWFPLDPLSTSDGAKQR